MNNNESSRDAKETDDQHERDTRVFRYRAYRRWHGTKRYVKIYLADLGWDLLHGLRRISFITQVIGIVVIVTYTSYTIRMYYANKESADAARSAANTAHDTLIASNRPWLDMDIVPTGPFRFDNTGGHLLVGIATSNFGHSPAIRVTSTQEFIQVIIGSPNPWQEIKNLCHEAGGASALASNRGVTQTVFPGKPQGENWDLSISNFELNRTIEGNFGIKPPPRLPYVYPVIVRCVAYSADFSKETHHIGYAWNVFRRDPRVANGIGLIDPKAGNLPQNQVLIIKYPFIGPLAD